MKMVRLYLKVTLIVINRDPNDVDAMNGIVSASIDNLYPFREICCYN